MRNIITIAAIAVIALFTGPAVGADLGTGTKDYATGGSYEQPVPKTSPFYVGVLGGYSFNGDLSNDLVFGDLLGGFLEDEFGLVTSSVDNDNSFHYAGVMGLRVADGWRVEFEASRTSFDGTGDVTGPSELVGPEDQPIRRSKFADVDVGTKVTALTVNLYRDFTLRGTSVMPYVGGGLGVAFVKHDLKASAFTDGEAIRSEDFVAALGEDVPVKRESISRTVSDAALTAQLAAGLRMPIAKHWMGRAGYKYQWIDAIDFDLLGSGDSIQSHKLEVGVTYNF